MSLTFLARQVAGELKRCQQRIVFAESCTGGLVCATLARVPGISNYLCGSAVTYRNDTKHHWLGVTRRALRTPGAVSELVARHMAAGVLKATPEANLSAAITGHLGPNAPPNADGLVFVAVSQIHSRRRGADLPVKRVRLQSSTRYARQREAVETVFGFVLETLRPLTQN